MVHQAQQPCTRHDASWHDLQKSSIVGGATARRVPQGRKGPLLIKRNNWNLAVKTGDSQGTQAAQCLPSRCTYLTGLGEASAHDAC